MKISMATPALATVHHQDNHAPQTSSAPQAEHSEASREMPLDLALKPRSRGIHPFLAVILGDKGCASSSSVSQGSDSTRDVDLDDFAVASRDVNRNNICAGLSTEWLLMSNSGNAQSRMDHLDHHGAGQSNGAHRHQVYRNALASALSDGDGAPLITASTAVLENAGLSLRREPKAAMASGGSARLAQTVASDVAQAGRKHLLSLRFASVQGHAIACSCEGGQFKLFDPNLGEFHSSRSAAPQMLKALIDHYNDLNYNLYGINEFRVS
ncbi:MULTISPECIES: YopT-type cysteine protease domain-containing protein [Pseudomonas syringae group]|uniref:YopT-type cysteine protease domain-containing protein n=3 Tax=Pseudomonas TaxID=286 RepID=A0AAE6QGZ4_9PSED|nr:YopT-type cysteine protease domain-containing protein [Pseudomonas tremae]QGT80420.1 YopT-type cysteine protease domain-containing protein [Pseudomonas coronafaciens pv. coronafaciens]QIQ73218.1 Cysteine protease avirulence protein AvrPphB [Pseudomonas coronafaciens]RMS29632.1 Cysteine protease [Pseudomonas coronafaciens pv. garcae]MCF5745243.1 YopT-type cysteine protease domain-containing protein [Pseudomonas tremae]